MSSFFPNFIKKINFLGIKKTKEKFSYFQKKNKKAYIYYSLL
jgi:hypothetical protein